MPARLGGGGGGASAFVAGDEAVDDPIPCILLFDNPAAAAAGVDVAVPLDPLADFVDVARDGGLKHRRQTRALVIFPSISTGRVLSAGEQSSQRHRPHLAVEQ